MEPNSERNRQEQFAGFNPKTDGRDELNLAEFPLALLADRAPVDQTQLIFEDAIFDVGSQEEVKRKLIITAGPNHGLPTSLDSDVLLGLIQLTKLTNEFTEPRVLFSRYQLVMLLSWDHGGKSYRRLEESLHRWAAVRLEYGKAWWDKKGKRWRNRSFPILADVDIHGREGGRPQLDLPLSSFTWSPVIFQSFQDGYIKRLDLEVYNQLKRPSAKRLYRFLDKRFHRRERVQMELRLLACEKIGFSRKFTNAKLKQKLRPGIEELEAIGFIVPARQDERYLRVAHGEWQIIFQKKASASLSDIGSREKSLFDDELTPFQRELIERGVGESVARELTSDSDIPASRIEEKIEFFDFLREKDPKAFKKNAAGFLVQSIRQNYSLPESFETKAQRMEKAAAKRRRERLRQQAEEEQRSAEQAKYEADTIHIQKYLGGLSVAERKQLDEDAISRGNGFVAEQYRRAMRRSEKKAAELYYEVLIRNHVLQLLANGQ